MNTDTWKFGDDPENIEECTECDELALYGELCLCCFDDGRWPDNDKDLDPERSHGYTFDVAAFFDAGRKC